MLESISDVKMTNLCRADVIDENPDASSKLKSFKERLKKTTAQRIQTWLWPVNNVLHRRRPSAFFGSKTRPDLFSPESEQTDTWNKNLKLWYFLF